MIDWTELAIDGCFTDPVMIADKAAFSKFQSELELRMQKNWTGCDIEWIWTQLENASSAGESFSQQARPIEPLGLQHRVSAVPGTVLIQDGSSDASQ